MGKELFFISFKVLSLFKHADIRYVFLKPTISEKGNWLMDLAVDSSLQCCYFDGASSDKSILTCDIPQGSSLGPLIFILKLLRTAWKT